MMVTPRSIISPRETCRVCGSKDLTFLFSLGEHFVSDFVTEDKVGSGVKCPVELELCRDCTLVQMRHTAPQELLYSRRYWYRSSVTRTMREALRNVVLAGMRSVDWHPGDVVLDIGSNDGCLLKFYPEQFVRVGVEPADNLATEENYKGLVLIHDFWGRPRALKRVRTLGAAKIVTACGMFYDLENPSSFIADVAKALHPEGVFIAQLMCLRNMVNTGDMGNLCHEHLEHYSLKSLDRLLGAHGLEIRDLETNAVNGESYRLYVRHKVPRRARGFSWSRLEQARRDEACLDRPEFYVDLFRGWEENKTKLVDFVRGAVGDGKRVWVLGASTKGNTLLQYWGLDRSLIEGAGERSPEKHGLFTVGTGIPIKSEEEARAARPDFFLILPYAFAAEIMEREHEHKARGGKFIVPLPSLKVV